MEGTAEEPSEPPAKKPQRPCDRCGNFAQRRNVFGTRLCSDCVEKALHRAASGPMTAGSILSGSVALAGAIALPALLVGLLPTALGFVFGAAWAAAYTLETLLSETSAATAARWAFVAVGAALGVWAQSLSVTIYARERLSRRE